MLGNLDAEPLLPLSIKLGFILVISQARFTGRKKKKKETTTNLFTYDKKKSLDDHFLWRTPRVLLVTEWMCL